jgi:hypothetical protein
MRNCSLKNSVVIVLVILVNNIKGKKYIPYYKIIWNIF